MPEEVEKRRLCKDQEEATIHVTWNSQGLSLSEEAKATGRMIHKKDKEWVGH